MPGKAGRKADVEAIAAASARHVPAGVVAPQREDIEGAVLKALGPENGAEEEGPPADGHAGRLWQIADAKRGQTGVGARQLIEEVEARLTHGWRALALPFGGLEADKGPPEASSGVPPPPSPGAGALEGDASLYS